MLLIALYERSQLSCKRQLCCIRFMVVVSVGLLFLSEDLAYFFPNSKRSIWPRAGGCFHQRAWWFLYPKLQLPCREPLISSLWLQHHAFNLRPRIQTKILMSRFLGPRFDFQLQVHVVVSCRPTPLFVICDLFQAMAWVLLGGPCKLELL